MNVPVPASESSPPLVTVLREPEWRDRMRRHQAKLAPVVNAHLDRAARGVRHPIIDFLFQYYPFAAAHLMRWTPGVGVALEGEVPPELVQMKDGNQIDAGWMVSPERFPRRRHEALAWVIGLLENTTERAPRFGCFGLHEWAMVYRSSEVRHGQLPLRFSHEETARIVESLPVNCSHYDAFRFFTPEARPLNRLQPALETRRDMEQRGCLHVNMDLYKWATQFYPWISSDLIADVFLLALSIREMDMRASPYDVTSLGHTPICIETDEGRREYVRQQQAFAEAAIPLRTRLVSELRLLSSRVG